MDTADDTKTSDDTKATTAASPTADVADASTPAEVEEEPEPEQKSKWVIFAGSAPITRARGAGIIVAESHDYPVVNDEGQHQEDAPRTTDGYAEGADVYVRNSDDVEFPDGGEVITIGQNTQQAGFGGFTKRPGWLHVGPASAVYAAANLAFQRGAKEIRIVGLDDRQKAHLQPFFDALPTHPSGPAPDVNITLA